MRAPRRLGPLKKTYYALEVYGPRIATVEELSSIAIATRFGDTICLMHFKTKRLLTYLNVERGNELYAVDGQIAALMDIVVFLQK